MHSTSVSAAETVLGRFFEAAVAPELWPNALQGLAEACGAEGAAVNAIDGLRTHGTVGSPDTVQAARPSRSRAGAHPSSIRTARAGSR